MTFREIERKRVIEMRNDMFNDPGNGLFFGKDREFVLNDPSLNLWEGIRKDALDYFANHGIQWWKGEQDGPTGHLLSSQVACVNHLYPLRQRQDLATLLLQSLDKSVKSAVIVDNGYVEFEFIGERQYLQERGFTRGANCTSVDAVMIGELVNGERCMFLIEWKYTESYTDKNLYQPGRAKVYDHLIVQKDSPFKYKNPQAYYFEPFYQLMRQTLLGWMLSQNNDHRCNHYRHVHVVPDGNKDLSENISSPELREKGQTILNVWLSILVDPDIFISITPERLMAPITRGIDSKSFESYLRKRYWVPRQNRVTPFGEFIATDARGTLMGNRGILHDDIGELTNSRWENKSWVTCALSFKGRRSMINPPGKYTQLFFLDEATALAVGHRPCGECRREDFHRFRDAWLKGNPDSGLGDDVSMPVIDNIIHAERVAQVGGVRGNQVERIGNLPDGVIVTFGASDQAWLLWQGELHHWRPEGYADNQSARPDQVVSVLTPNSIVRTIAAGYHPKVTL